MANRELKKALNPAKRSRTESKNNCSEDSDEEEDELEDLETEVQEMAEKIIDLRRSIPELLSDVTSSSSISLLRPKLPPGLGSVAAHPDGADCSSRSLDETGERDHEKLNVLREKVMSSITAAPVILNRMRECLARINKIKQCNVDMHSAFKRPKK